MQSLSVTIVDESGLPLKKTPPPCDFLSQDARHCLSITLWQNSTEHYCAASVDILLQLVAKSDYVLY